MGVRKARSTELWVVNVNCQNGEQWKDFMDGMNSKIMTWHIFYSQKRRNGLRRRDKASHLQFTVSNHYFMISEVTDAPSPIEIYSILFNFQRKLVCAAAVLLF